MKENIENKIIGIDEQQFITAKDLLCYVEEHITVSNMLLNYSLSNSLDDIKIAIFKRTGLDIKLEQTKWIINSYLSVNVKLLMNKYQTAFSMTTYHDEKVRIIIINMRVNDNWFITRYAELKGKCYHWDYFSTLEKLKRFIEHYLSSDKDEDEDDD